LNFRVSPVNFSRLPISQSGKCADGTPRSFQRHLAGARLDGRL
jgi:hypothetical protein